MSLNFSFFISVSFLHLTGRSINKEENFIRLIEIFEETVEIYYQKVYKKIIFLKLILSTETDTASKMWEVLYKPEQSQILVTTCILFSPQFPLSK